MRQSNSDVAIQALYDIQHQILTVPINGAWNAFQEISVLTARAIESIENAEQSAWRQR